MEYEGLTFVTVRGAGHEVPRHRPEQALVLFQHFLQGEPMPAEVSFTFRVNLLMVTNKNFIGSRDLKQPDSCKGMPTQDIFSL